MVALESLSTLVPLGAWIPLESWETSRFRGPMRARVTTSWVRGPLGAGRPLGPGDI
jgi:hypothetical protein